MTTRRFCLQVDLAATHDGRLRLHSGPMTINVEAWAPAQLDLIRKLLRARLVPVVHLRADDTHLTLESVEAADEPVVNAIGGVA